MPVIVVRYRTKPDRSDENQQLVEKVYAQLAERKARGFRYMTIRLDGDEWVHVLEELDEAGDDLSAFPAFQQFVAAGEERWVEPPVVTRGALVGSYRFGDG